MTQTANLVVNGNAETGALAPDYNSVDAPPGWATTGAFTQIAYADGTATGDMGPTQSAAINGGNGFFAGGNNSGISTATQTIDVSSYASVIDQGAMNFAASGDFGGWDNQDDTMNMTVTFLGADDSTVLGTTTIDGPSATARNDTTEFLYEENDGAVPTGTRYVQVELQAVRASGAYNDGYADNISLTLNSNDLINGNIVVTATTDYSQDKLQNVPSITFQTSANSTATFLASQFGGIGGGGINSNATITGDAHTDTIQIILGSDNSFDGSNLQLANWSANDEFKIIGTSGNDTITGTSGTDLIEPGNGADVVNGGAGNDEIDMGSHFNTSDQLNGGAGTNDLKLSGDYSTFMYITPAMLQNIEKISLTAGHGYEFAIEPGVVAAGQIMTIDASTLGNSDVLDINLANDTAGKYIIDTGKSEAIIDLNTQSDTVDVGSGSDYAAIYVNGLMPNTDKIEGDGGGTSLYLNGDYSSGLAFKASTITNVGTIYLAVGFSYNLTTNDANVAAGATMYVEASELGSGNSFIFNGSHETDGSFIFYCGDGYDKLTGGGGGDVFSFSNADTFTAADRIDGGGGYNYLDLQGDYTSGLDFANSTIKNIQDIELSNDYGYKLILANGNVAAGQTLTIDASSLSPDDTLYLNGSKVLSGNLAINAGAGNDTLIAGAGSDIIYGYGGADKITAGTGHDKFEYGAVSDSTGTARDTITGFNAATDVFYLFSSLTTPGVIDPDVTVGHLSNGSGFDAQLTADLGANQLGAYHAVLFTPNSGGLAGHAFLVVDENGVAGYQASQDLVIDITGATNLSSFSTANFTT